MILEEAVKRYLENGMECEKEYKQLVEWLEDYNEKSKLVRYFYNYYPTDSHCTCPKCGEYVMDGLICLSCNTITPKGEMKDLNSDISEYVNKHFHELL